MGVDDSGDDRVEIDILLSISDGASHLPAQLESLAAQTHERWRLLVRDDLSRDNGLQVIQEFASSSTRQVVVFAEPQNRVGPVASYARLMEEATSPYIMFCDQDDVWDRDKIARSLEAMRTLEARHGSDVPLLVHSDLRVADRDLATIADSFWSYQHLDPHTAQQFERLLIHNVVTGCATLANLPLVSLATPIPKTAVMHDWWLALTASAFGKIGAIEHATLSYCQHGANAMGARRFDRMEILGRSRKPLDRGRLLENTRAASAQARAFLERFESRMTERQRGAASALGELLEQGFIGRRASIIRHGLYKVGWIRNLATLVRI